MEFLTILTSIRDDLKKLTKLFNMLTVQELNNIGITRSQSFVIREVIEGPKTIGQISKAVDLSYSTTSGVIDRLEKNGYLKRTRDEEDRRVVWIDKTEKVQELGKQLTDLHEKYYRQVLEGLCEEELQTFHKTLLLLTQNLEKKVEEIS